MARLARTDDGLIGGVCAGIAHRFGWSPKVVRLAFLASCLLPGPQFVIYIGLWIFLPKEQYSWA